MAFFLKNSTSVELNKTKYGKLSCVYPAKLLKFKIRASAWLRWSLLGSAWLGFARLGIDWLRLARRGSTQLGSTRLGLAQLGPARWNAGNTFYACIVSWRLHRTRLQRARFSVPMDYTPHVRHDPYGKFGVSIGILHTKVSLLGMTIHLYF